MLREPNWSLSFHICTNVSNIDLQVVLAKKENEASYAIYLARNNLAPTTLNYTVTEKDFLAIVLAINKFRHYITCYEVFTHRDH